MYEVNVNNYKLVDYYDVWGNEKEGYEVNNLCTLFDDLCITEDCTDEEIFDFLKQLNYFKKEVTFDQVEFDWMDDTICELTDKSTGCPLGRLEKTN